MRISSTEGNNFLKNYLKKALTEVLDEFILSVGIEHTEKEDLMTDFVRKRMCLHIQVDIGI